ncbi:peroxidase-related enzyme [Longispora sp. K20-0274]|uniref:peroxidase-related enzyme n=1 Tax=Longispora sp. K20-0274 TaxID=3088255 RepID=UPI00399BCBD3
MRLRVLDQGHRPRQRLALRLMRLLSRTAPDPVVQVSLYRPELFGQAWMRFVESAMRGPSEWTEGERELFGAFVSRLNACEFCVGVHEGTTTLLLGPGDVDRLDHWRDGGFGPKVTAMFALLEKVTLKPDHVRPADVRTVRAAGLSDTAILDALYVGFLFNTVNRLANALDFRWRTDTDRMRLAAGLVRSRYHVPDFLLR